MKVFAWYQRSSTVHACKNTWACCPSALRLLILFVAGNIIGDILSFPIAHTFWNLMQFEGWYANE